MKIALVPQRGEPIAVVKNGDALTINGEEFDFTPLPDGGTIPVFEVPCPWIFGPVERIDGEIHVTIILPFGEKPEEWQLSPSPLHAVADGPVDLPTNTLVTEERTPAQGGTIVKTTTRRWHQPDQVDVTFEPALEDEPS